MPVVTMAEFEKRLSQHKGTLVATFVTRTRPEMKRGNPFKLGVERVAVRGFMLGARYANSVNLQREREGLEPDFEPLPLWVSKKHPEGEGEHDTPFTVRHRTKGTRYFYAKPTKTDEDGNPIVYADRYYDVATGIMLDEAAVRPWLKGGGGSTRQGTDKPTRWRTVEMANVEQIRTFRQVFDIIGEPSTLSATA